MKRNIFIRLSMVVLIAGLAGCGATASLQPVETPQGEEKAAVVTPSIQAMADTPTATEQAGPWKVVFRTAMIQHSVNIAGFLNETFGITAGYAGEVHYTVDSAKNWSKADNVSACRYGMDIVDENLAWTIGNQGNVRVSKDGAKTWQAVTDVTIGLSQFISFVDEKTGWAGNLRKLVTTGDGGKTWTEVVLPDAFTGIAAIHLRTPEEGYVVDKSGMLFITQDGGKEWAAKPLGEEKTINAPENLPGGAVRFMDSDHGVVIINLEDGSGALIAFWTANGGNTWTRETLPEKTGVLFLSHDARFLTVFTKDFSIVLLQHMVAAGE
jgi:photosystem II stability/assembly factor-like uncharacterized protein